MQVNDGRLRTAGEASQRSTKEDWAEWMRHFSIELLKESPSPALRTCARLAQLQVLLIILVSSSPLVLFFCSLGVWVLICCFCSHLLGGSCLQLDLLAVGHS